jgi:hypothetical protein
MSLRDELHPRKSSIHLNTSNVSAETNTSLPLAQKAYTYRYAISAFVILLLNACMRLVLVAHDWPQTNSDEGTVGLMALHIFYHRDYPIFLYGAGFLGSLEAYVGAALFFIFGPTLFSLRVGMIVLFTLFLISMYLLTYLLYTKKLALFTLVVLSLASPELLFRELAALAGHPETPLFGAVIMLLTTWLALTYRPGVSPRDRRRRVVMYGTWGLVVGAALWNDPLVASFILMAGLFLLVFCRAELYKATLLSIGLGCLVGISPLLIYNFTVPTEQKSFSVFGFLTYTATTPVHHSLLENFAAALLVSVPVATEANPLCLIGNRESWPLTAQSSPHVIQCTIVHGCWGLGILVLWAVAVFLAARELRNTAFRIGIRTNSPLERRPAIIQCARLMLLASAGLSLLVFTLSPQALVDPWSNNRYLVAFAVATPAVIWPLWATMSTTSLRPAIIKILSFGLLFLLVATLALGTIDSLQQMPQAETGTQQRYVLVHDLLRLGATRIYTDYWTCDLVAFLSQEQIVCATLDEHLQPAFDRYTPYKMIVHNDPHASYVFPVGSPQAVAFAAKIARSGELYQLTVVDGYEVYQPEG